MGGGEPKSVAPEAGAQGAAAADAKAAQAAALQEDASAKPEVTGGPAGAVGAPAAKPVDRTLSGERNNILTFIEEMFAKNFIDGIFEGAEKVILTNYINLNNLSNCLVDDCEHRD